MRSAPLDGLRAIAVVAVLAHHAHYGWAVGGYLGVDVFFVLSGYLITGVLLSTHRSWWGYRDFLLRRAVRLVPALVVALVAAAVLVAVQGSTQERSVIVACSAAAGGYVMNLPFAEGLSCPAPWHVTWSLAAEQQFYLLWPLLLLVLLAAPRRLLSGREPGRRWRLRFAAGVAAALYACSLVWQLLLRAHHGGAARLSFAPDTRSLVLLLGCALALGLAARSSVRQQLRARRSDGAKVRGRELGAVVGLGVLALCFTLGDISSGLVPIAAAGIATASLIAVLAHAPRSCRAARWVGAAPLAYLGRISYSLYLWHELAYRLVDLLGHHGSVVSEISRWALAIGLAAASHRWVEQPVQRWWRTRGAVEASAPQAPAYVAG